MYDNQQVSVKNHGGVRFDNNSVKSYGARKNEKGDTVYFINFYNGTKIEYPKQSDGSIECDKSRCDTRDDSCSMTFNNIKGGTIWDGPLDDHYYLNESSDMKVYLNNEQERKEYDGKTFRDYDHVHIGINKICVIGDEAKVNDLDYKKINSPFSMGDNNTIYW